MYCTVAKAPRAFGLGRDTGACQLRGWAGELRRAADSHRDQAEPTGLEYLLVWCVTFGVAAVPW
jgi:hypothetical protein